MRFMITNFSSRVSIAAALPSTRRLGEVHAGVEASGADEDYVGLLDGLEGAGVGPGRCGELHAADRRGVGGDLRLP
ncbi:MAG: hypothetical protein ABDI20_08765, partial [Candidatus Bipolaricaulaceae bacterium]